MANLLLGGVMQGLVGASGAMKTADTAYFVYVQKKAQGDEEGMRRAMGYASEAMGEANKSTEDSKAALAENIEAAREQEKAEQAERLEKARQEAAEKKAETEAGADETKESITNPVDTIEISPEAAALLQGEQTADSESADTVASNDERPAKHAGKSTAQREDGRHQVFRIQGSGRDAANPKLKTLDIKV